MNYAKYILVAVLPLLMVEIFAQNTRQPQSIPSYKAIADREPTKAIYRTFDDFKYNRPTPREDIAMVGENLAYWNESAGRYSNFVEPFWGAIIDSVLFVKLGIHTYPLEILGKYSMISENFLPVYRNSYKPIIDHIVNLETGKIIKMDKGSMIKILQKEAPQLVNTFKDEYDKFLYCPKYLIMVNEMYEP